MSFSNLLLREFLNFYSSSGVGFNVAPNFISYYLITAALTNK